MKNNVAVYGIIIALLLSFRILIDKNDQLLLFVAAINIVALLVVVSSITSNAKAIIKKKITLSGVPDAIVAREVKIGHRRIDYYTYIPLVIICLAYLFFIHSELGNDIISIVALGLSLTDSFISNGIVKTLYKE